MKISETPKYQTLARILTRQIREGALRPGDKLPSYAQMRVAYGATPSTVERVHALLDHRKLIERRHRSGVYVADSAKVSRHGVLGFAALCFSGSRLHPYHDQMLHGIQRAARENDVQILLLNSNVAASLDKVDGLLISQSQDVLSEFLPYQREGVPCVSLLTKVDDIASVTADDFQGSKSATQDLLDLGHRRIAALMTSVPEDGYDSLGEQRLAGYRDAMREAGLRADRQWVRPLRYNPLHDYAGQARECMEEWLAGDWRKLGCTAILAQNDDVAIGIVQAFRKAGLRVPADVSVVGFDGAGADQQFSPRLTTVAVPLEEIGRQGTEMLLRCIRGEAQTEHRVLPAALRVGKSSAHPASARGTIGKVSDSQ